MRRTPREAVNLTMVGLAAVAAAAPAAPAAVERWFSTGLYPHLQQAVTPVSNAVPFALFDALCIAAFAAIIAALVRAARAWRARGSRHALGSLGHVVAAAAVVYLVFLALWGFNYRRVPMTDRLLLDAVAPAPDAVVQLGLEAAARLNDLHDPAHRSGWPPPVQNAALRRAFETVQRELSDAPPAVPGRLKQTLLGPYLRWVSIDGMINPFGLEVLANPDLLPFERPFVAAHEWAHLAGYADESEASFVGWLVCVRASVDAQYSGWLALYWQVTSEVNEAERARMTAALGPGPRRDIEAVVARIRRGEWPWLQNVGWRVYDRYLKANRVEEGVRSYGAVVTLILRARFEDGWVPRRRASRAPDRPRGT